jgi:hypothetical protein
LEEKKIGPAGSNKQRRLVHVCLSKMAARRDSCLLAKFAILLAISTCLSTQVTSVRVVGTAEVTLRMKQLTLDRCPYLRGGDGTLARPLRIMCAPLWLRLKGGRRDEDDYGSDEDERSYGASREENERSSRSRGRSSSRDASVRNNKDDGDEDFEKISGEEDDNDDDQQQDEQMTDEAADRIQVEQKQDGQQQQQQEVKDSDDEDITDVPDEEIDEGFFKGLQTGKSLFAKQGQGQGAAAGEDEDEDDDRMQEEEERTQLSSVEDIAGDFDEMDEVKAAAAAQRDDDEDVEESEEEKMGSLDKLGDLGLGGMGEGEEEQEDEDGSGREMLIPMPGMEDSDDNETLSSTSSSFNFSGIMSEDTMEKPANKSAVKRKERLDLRKGPLGYMRGKVLDDEREDEVPAKSLAE